MDKRTIIGLGIFVVILASLLSISFTMDTSAQMINSLDSNKNLSSISYTLDLNDLNITLQNTSDVFYTCILSVNNISYQRSGHFENVSNGVLTTINVNQSLNPSLSDGYYASVLSCIYTINESSQIRNVTLITLKNILVDSAIPVISIRSLNNLTVNMSSGPFGNSSDFSLNFSLNLTVADISITQCSINISNSLLNVSSNNTINGSINALDINIPLHTTINSSYNSYMIPYVISCIDSSYNRNALNSSIMLYVNVGNDTGNYTNSTGNATTDNSTNTTVTEPFFNIDVSSSAFNLGAMGYYTINALNGSNVSITICPVASGWVQCYVSIPFVNESFPKTLALPYTNKTGSYRIDGVMKYRNVSIAKNTTYETSNTLTASITASSTVAGTGDTITFNASASSGIGSYTYRWTMHDGAVFNGIGAYKVYNTPGTFRVNLTVNDSVGNTFTTYVDVTIKNYFTLSVVVLDSKDSSRINNVEVRINSGDDNVKYTDSNGVASFKLLTDDYNIYVSKDNYGGYVDSVYLNSDQTVYMNMSFIDLTPPTMTLLTDSDLIFNKDNVDLKFKASDSSHMSCSLYIAGGNDSWFTLKDSGTDLVSDTEYTFEIRDLSPGAYKWKIECSDADSNKADSEERKFVVSDENITTALQAGSQDSSDLNTILDNLGTLSGDEYDVAQILGIKSGLEDLLDRVNRLDKDIYDLSYRRDLNDSGKAEAQNNLTQTIVNMKANTPIGLRILESKTFVKYVHDDTLRSITDSFLSIKNLNLDHKAFSQSTKLAQSRVIISTHVSNIELYYMDGRTEDITLVVKDIQAAKPEDDMAINSSTTITFLESIPKDLSQSARMLSILNKDYTILQDDPLIEYPSSTRQIVYSLNGKVSLDSFEGLDTVLIDKKVDALSSTTGFSIAGISSISDINLDSRSLMIIAVILLVLFYIIINFDIIDKVRNIITGAGAKKKISFIRVLINDSLDYLQTGDFDKAALIYREIKLSYEEANEYVKQQVYDESMELCNELDLSYAFGVLERVESYIRMGDRRNAALEFGKLENTYNRIDAKHRLKINERFQRILSLVKN